MLAAALDVEVLRAEMRALQRHNREMRWYVFFNFVARDPHLPQLKYFISSAFKLGGATHSR